MGIANLAFTVERHALAVATRRDLGRLSDGALADIGLSRDQLAATAAAMADHRLGAAPARTRFAFWGYFRGLARI